MSTDKDMLESPGVSIYEPSSRCILASDFTPTIPWPDPTPEQLNSIWFNKIWDVIKTWDINVPEAYEGYCGATGNHVVAILNAIVPDKTQS